ncbi:MAG: hypothetical protein H0X31_01070 [Nostocaceae cyanobacterium]|nr:hypothetical protein [Nostocaceae cyanobacterium]
MKNLRIGIILLICLITAIGIDAQDNLTPSNDILYVTAVSWNSDGNKIVAVGIQQEGQQGYLRVIDSQTGQILYQLDPRPGGFTSVAWSPNNRFIAAGGYDEAIWIIDVEAGSVVKVLYGHQSTVSDLDWNMDGTQLVSTGNWDGLTILWDMTTYQKVRVIEATSWFTLATAFSPNDQHIAVGGENGIRVYSSMSNNSEKPFWSTSEIFYVGALAWNHKGNQIAIGSESFQSIVNPKNKSYAQIYLLDSSNGKQLSSIATQDDTIFGIAWSPDDTLISTYSKNGYVKVWEANSGLLLQSFLGTTAYPEKLSFSPYGGRLAYGGSLPINSGSSTTLVQTNIEGTQSLAGGAVQVIVPDPSLARLQAITQNCGIQLSVQQSLTSQINTNKLQDFVTEVSALTDDQIPLGCKADLLAVADALLK